jgi:hypothetical protein
MIRGQTAGLKIRRGADSLGAIPMLPATLRFIIAMIAYAINERMAEGRLLAGGGSGSQGGPCGGDRQAPDRLSAEQRRRLALKGKELTAEERGTCCQIVRPETILAWFRQLAAQKYDGSKARKAGRPRKAADIRTLVLELASDNRGGATPRSGTRYAG